ncbi:MAG: hypothetical protein WBM09_03100 [Gallionella sp.]
MRYRSSGVGFAAGFCAGVVFALAAAASCAGTFAFAADAEPLALDSAGEDAFVAAADFGFFNSGTTAAVFFGAAFFPACVAAAFAVSAFPALVFPAEGFLGDGFFFCSTMLSPRQLSNSEIPQLYLL